MRALSHFFYHKTHYPDRRLSDETLSEHSLGLSKEKKAELIKEVDDWSSKEAQTDRLKLL